MGEVFDAGGGARKEDRAFALFHHPLCRLLCNEKAAEGGGHHGLLNFAGIELDERPARAGAGIEQDDVGRPELRLHIGEQSAHRGRLRHINGKGGGAGLL